MTTVAMPAPDLFFDTMNAYQRTAALKAAIQLELFTAIGEGADNVTALAKRCLASERGIRILCDYLTVTGLLTKAGARYELTPESAAFLAKQSPAYLGGTVEFLATPDLVRNFDDLAATVRRGSVADAGNTIAEYENPIWVQFARAMVPMMMPAAQAMVDILQVASAPTMRVLDIAAGHGIFGLTIAQHNPAAEIVAVDWPGVLAVASENAQKMGVQARHRTIPGDAFKVEYGTGYDIALLTNFLHHFDPPTCTALLRKVAAAVKPGGRVAILEFVPNEDRVSPPIPAKFGLSMLAGTPGGDAYTLDQLRTMAEDAGFHAVTAYSLPMPETVVVATT